ncbi:MAG: hypothetical protein FD146_2375 [Anaerolineaceae bacterium]|nr:MAG: hypothetical protein FD146_2375 [Anaerolineaceae bacterium]
MKKLPLILPALLLALSILACGSFSPPESCGDEIGGTANETLFGENFESMELVSAGDWQPGAQGENGVQFAGQEPLLLMFDAKADVDVRACIQNTQGGGQLAFDQTAFFSEGTNVFPVGAFEPGNYVIRVIVDGALVKNFPFEVK